jgi:3-hydroxyisobutyrate dehydrogenase-like beta-hydroxyacid dehydrogenase
MADLTMIGLGAMGSALARAFLGAGHSVTVWNRSPNKAKPLLALGAKSASTIADAVTASPIIVVCIDNYKATRDLISEESIGHALSGRTMIQLSTGTPREAHELEDWIVHLGGAYIDGAIMPYPDGIGARDAKILFAGPEITYERCLPFLSCLGGDLRYLGENISAAAALDLALLTHELCDYLGAIHGAHLCESENISVEVFASMFPDGHPAKGPAQVIHSGKYNDPGATLTVWDGALQRIQAQAHDAGISCEVPDFISSLFKRAISAGYGQEDVAAIVKVLRTKTVT